MKQQMPQLPLFTETVGNSKKQVITEEQIVSPLVELLNNTATNSTFKKDSKEITKTINESLNDLFPEQQYDEKDVQKVKAVLGQQASMFSSEQIKDEVTKMQYLCETWLDDFERNIFNGVTLQELLHEKGGK